MKTRAYSQILQLIEQSKPNFIESPLLPEQSILFYKNVNEDNYFQFYDYLLIIEDSPVLGKIDFLQIKKDELLQIQKLYSSKNENQKKLLIQIMLLIVLKQNAYYDIFDVGNVKYKLLLDPAFLPNNPKEKCILQLIQYINNFFVDEFNNHPKEVVESIYNYFKQMNDDNSLYNFFPFFLRILKDSDKQLIKKFTDSELLIEIIRISNKELPIYDLYRHIISIFPEIAFANSSITMSLLEIFFNEDKNQSIVNSFERALNVLDEYNPISNEIMIVISSLIEEARKKDKQKSQLVFGLNTCIVNLFNIISPDVGISSFLKALASFAISDENEESFEFSINLIRKLIIQRASFIFKLRNDKNFFLILSKYQKKFKFYNMFSLATCEVKYIPRCHRFIRLYEAIQLLITLLPNIPEDEATIATYLYELSQNPGNIIELDRAKIPDFIIERFPVIQDNEEIREKYLNLFSKITSETFDNMKFYHTFELLKNKEFKYSGEILAILNKHLLSYIRNESLRENSSYMTFLYRCERLNLYNTPFSFYRFDNQTGCGIISPKMSLTGNFSFCLWIRLNDIDSDLNIPFIYFDHDKYHLDMYFYKNKLFLKYFHTLLSNETKEIQHPTEFDPIFEQGRWYFLCFTFKKGLLNNYILSLDLFDDNNNQKTSRMNCSFNSGEYKLHICRRPLPLKHEIDHPSLICDMSTFLLLNDLADPINVKRHLIQYLSSNERNIGNFENVLCLFNPLESRDNFCFNVNKNILRVPYSGRAIPIITIFRDVIQNIVAINSLLPLINMLPNEDNSNKGKYNLHLLLSIFSNAINICENSFVKLRFFELLASFLYHCEKLIDSNTIKDLYLMFTRIHNPELQKSMIKSIYLNSEFLSKIDQSITMDFFSFSPLDLYDNREYHFKVVFEDLSQIVYRAVSYHDKVTQQSKYFWNFVKKLCIDSPNDINIEMLAELLCSNKSEYVILNILDILFDILYSKEDFNSTDFNFTPYIIAISRFHDSIKILELSLKIIQIVATKIDLGIKLYSTVYQLIYVFNPSEKALQDFIEYLVNMVQHMIMEEDIISFFPFLVTLLKRSKSLKLNRSICNTFARTKSNVQSKISTIPLWTYWLTNFYLQAYNPNPNENPNEFADLCISIINNTKQMIELLDFFDYYNAVTPTGTLYNNTKVDFTKAKEKILIYLINNDEKFMKKYSSYIFNYIFFEVTNTKKERSNSPLNNYDEIMLELSGVINIDVSLRNSVNKEVIKHLIRKTNLNMQSEKVQICDGKIEISLIEANAFLSILLDEKADKKDANAGDTKELDKYKTISNEILQKCIPAYKTIINHKLLATGKDITNIIQFKREYPDNEKNDASIEEKLLYISDPDKFEHYITNYPQFIKEQDNKLKIENNFLLKMKDSFLKIISKTPGPWENVNKTPEIRRFKMLNRVSKTGKKLLMKINDKFNDHSDASSNRGNKKIINEFEKLVYKTLETLPYTSKFNNFKIKVVILSPSKQEDGSLMATENFITLTTETKNICIYWEEVEFILNRRVAHEENSCEIFKNNGRSYFIIFTECEKKNFYSYIDKLKLPLDNQKNVTKFDFFCALRQVSKGIYQNKKNSAILQDLDLTNLWKKRKITTFSYIYYLNMLSGRTYNDLRQYPIFPFILSKLSDCFYLKDEQFYRDFSIPIFALSGEKVKSIINSKYKEFPEGQTPYLFGELPSSALVVAWYLVRVEPYTTIHVTQFQNAGKYPRFDLPDRIFKSFKSVMDYSKEFIPEFFYTPSFLVNENEFDFGVGSDHVKIQDVILPEWARNSYCFVSIIRLMLEGEIADKMISKWIDITFGPKRRTIHFEGKDYNLYKPYCFPETPNSSFDQEVLQFGSMPEQLFTESHPSRLQTSTTEPFEITILCDELNEKAHLIKNLLVCSGSSKAFEIKAATKEASQIYLPNISGNILCYSKCLNLAIFGTKTDPFLSVYNLTTKTTKTCFHIPSIITSVALAGGCLLVIGGQDCSIRVWDLSGVNSTSNQISSSSFHSDWITSIGCCYDNGILVSSDRKMTLVFESLIDHVFINSVSLKEIKNKINEITSKSINVDEDIEFKNMISCYVRHEDILKDFDDYNQVKMKSSSSEDFDFDDIDLIPQICVFKSGVIVVCLRSVIIFFDHQGKLMSIKKFEANKIEIHKCYGDDTREFLIIGINQSKINIFDVSLLSLIAVYDTFFSTISTIPKSCQLMTYFEGKVKSFSFAEYKSLMIKFQHVNPAHISK